MKNLIRLITIANKLDKRGLTRQADQLDDIITKLAQSLPHDDDDEKLSQEEALKWLEADRVTEGDEDLDMFGGDGPSREELMAMEQGIDLFEGEDKALLQQRLETLTREMEIFSEALATGKLEPEEFEMFERIKQEFLEVTKLVEETEVSARSVIPEA